MEASHKLNWKIVSHVIRVKELFHIFYITFDPEFYFKEFIPEK